MSKNMKNTQGEFNFICINMARTTEDGRTCSSNVLAAMTIRSFPWLTNLFARPIKLHLQYRWPIISCYATSPPHGRRYIGRGLTLHRTMTDVTSDRD